MGRRDAGRQVGGAYYLKSSTCKLSEGLLILSSDGEINRPFAWASNTQRGMAKSCQLLRCNDYLAIASRFLNESEDLAKY